MIITVQEDRDTQIIISLTRREVQSLSIGYSNMAQELVKQIKRASSNADKLSKLFLINELLQERYS